MKKNIVLIDLDLILIKSIHASENVNIEYLIVEANDNKIDELKSLYGIKNILSRERFDEYTEQHADELDYKTIEKFRVSQLNSEYFQSRFSDDVSLKQYKYFNALSFIFCFNLNIWIGVCISNPSFVLGLTQIVG